MCAGAVIIRRQGPADTSDEDSEDEAEVEVEAAPEPVEPELPARDPLEVGNMVQSVGQAYYSLNEGYPKVRNHGEGPFYLLLGQRPFIIAS